MKLIRGLALGFIFLFVFSIIEISFASAQTPLDDVKSVLDDIYSSKFVKSLLGGKITDSGDDLLPARLLFLLLVFSIVFGVSEYIPVIGGQGWIKFVVSGAVSILAIRYIEDEFVRAILLPYSTIGIALSTIIPFLVWGFVVFKTIESKALRRIAWIFFFVVFTTLWIVRYPDIGSGNVAMGAKWIYPITALLSLAMIVFDGTIRKFMLKVEVEKAGLEAANEAILEQKRKLVQAHKDFADGILNKIQYGAKVKQINQKITEIGGKI